MAGLAAALPALGSMMGTAGTAAAGTAGAAGAGAAGAGLGAGATGAGLGAADAAGAGLGAGAADAGASSLAGAGTAGAGAGAAGGTGTGLTSYLSGFGPMAKQMGMNMLQQAPSIYGQMEAARGRPGGALLGSLGGAAMQGMNKPAGAPPPGQPAPGFLKKMANQATDPTGMTSVEEWMQLQNKLRGMMGRI